MRGRWNDIKRAEEGGTVQGVSVCVSPDRCREEVLDSPWPGRSLDRRGLASLHAWSGTQTWDTS